MPTITEEEGVAPEDTQLGEFFDFHRATEPQVDTSGTQSSGFDCQPGDRCFSPGFVIDEPQALLTQLPPEGTEYRAEDYGRFQDWIPRFVKPDEPCGYCRSRNLNCYLNYGKLTCTACDTLFRPCSFANVDNDDHTHDNVPSDMGVLDTLHPVTEDVTQEHGELTSTRVLKSKSAKVDDKKTNPRFSRAAVKVLKDWVEAHQSSPYPSEDEKSELCKLTGLRYGQINTWLANARRRGKVGRGRPKGASSPSIRHSSPIGIPSTNIEVINWENMNPLERWKHSPPMNEPAPMNAIKDALTKNELPPLEASSPSTLGYTGFGSSRDESGTHSASNRRAPSMTSLEQLASESGTSSAAWSGSHDSFGSFSSFGSGLNGKRDRRRRRRGAQSVLKKPGDDKTKRVFQCTFCTDTFKSKYDWSRHEKSLHLSLEKFICCPLGPQITDTTTGDQVCAYCLLPNPTKDHLETHGHQTCVEKGLDSRTFYRKDHLRQHLRLMHNSLLLPHMDTWKVEVKFINSRCGFCTQRFTSWQERVDHIAQHFKEGRRMMEWKGCRGLDPSIAANVLNAMPPYLIGIEQASPNPFSATSPKRCMTVANHLQNGGPPATCWEILTIRLGRFAKEQADKGVVLTDELLQSQARLILYDDPDPWNQTAADNPEWLDLFKQAHGLDFIPSAVGGLGKNIPQDLEWYGDLGMRVPFSVQLQQGSTEDIPAGAQGLKQVGEQATKAQSTFAVQPKKMKENKTIIATNPEIGAQNEGQNVDSQSDSERAQMLCFLGLNGSALDDPSASTTRTNSTGDMLGLHQDEVFSNPVMCDLGYYDPVCIMSGLGIGAGKMAETPHDSAYSNTSPNGSSNAHVDLNAISASVAAGTSCCRTGECMQHQGQQSSRVVSFSMAEDFSGASGQFTIDSFPNPVGLVGYAPVSSSSSAGPAASASASASAAPKDISMGDFDFNDLSFNDMNFESVDLNLFDTTMDDFTSGS